MAGDDSRRAPRRTAQMAWASESARTPNSAARGAGGGRDGDSMACSPSAVGRARESPPATQIVCRPVLALPVPSSPASIIEVPASSPFQHKQSSRLGSRLAPTGSHSRQPPSPPPPTAMASKRPPSDPLELASDDEDGLAPPRGEIPPTAFKSQLAAFAYSPAMDEREMKKKLRQIYDVLGATCSSAAAREALEACNWDLDDALSWLETRPRRRQEKTPQKPAAKRPNGRRLISKGSLKGMAQNPNLLSQASSPSASPSPQKQRKRRLLQGLRKQIDSPSRSPGPPWPSSDDPLIADLADNDAEDAYQAEDSPQTSDHSRDRVLTYINTSTVKELAAMTGMKESLIEPMMEKRPFDDLEEAKRVSANNKPGSRKSAKICIGESVVEAVQVFMNAASAIDDVVASCERKAQKVKAVVDTWDLDPFGKSRRSRRSTPDKDLPPTPTSLGSSRYTQPLIPRQPELMDGHCEMKPFQLFGLNWMSLLYRFDIGCILADEMGLGKTCQVISFICHLVEDYERLGRGRRPWPNLIVVPPSTYNNWLIEFERFAPDISVIGYRGTQSERAAIAYEVKQEPEAFHVVLATYSQINSDYDVADMQSLKLNTAIFDEGHKMKNPETKIYQDLKRIPAGWKMLLTGTPVQNNLLEMTSLLSFINPKMFEGCRSHVQHIFRQKVTVRDVSNGAFLYNERVKRARTILEPFILQRRKDQVLSDMPRKINTVVYCDMSETQRPVYDEYEAAFRLGPSQRVGWAGGRQNDQNNIWMQLRKAALHPLLFRRHFTDEKVEEMGKTLMDRVPQSELHQPDIKHLTQELKNSSDFELHLWCRDYPRHLKEFDMPAAAELDSGKVKKLLELLGRYREKGDRVLVFSKFSRLIELLREVLEMRGIAHLALMGNTNVSERQTLIDEFDSNPAIPVFLLTTGAGGTGINLAAANKVIIMDQSDNPQEDIQAENRAHRLGQRRDVEVVRLISSHTIEELIYKACQKKIELANKVTGAAADDDDDDVAEQNMEQTVRKMMEAQMTPP